MDRIRILIAGESLGTRELLRQLCQSRRGVEIVGEADRVENAAALLCSAAPCVLLCDYEFCRKLQKHKIGDERSGPPGDHKIVVMIDKAEREVVLDSFRFGVQGIVLRDSSPGTWWRSIRAVVAGHYWLGSESLAVLVHAIRESTSRSTGAVTQYGLTRRELEIIQKIANGRSNKEVSRDFSIRERTVKHHLTNIFGKVGVSSRLELALFARDHEMIASVDPSRSKWFLRPDDKELTND